MKEFLGIVAAIVLGVIIYGFCVGFGGNTAGTLAGSANSLAQNAVSQIGTILP